MSYRVLIVEDEQPIADIINFNLVKEGYETEVAYNGEDGLEKFASFSPHIIVLDLMLPGKDGFSVCKEIRSQSSVPILVLTAKDSEVDKVLGLELGADDYVTKPFGNRELLARIKALLRRVNLSGQDSSSSEKDEDILKYNDVEINLKTAEVKKQGQAIDLTYREFQLFVYLVKRQGEVISRERMIEEVWGYDFIGEDRTVDVTIRRLREKLEDDPGSPSYIMTKRGMGYYLRRT
ncbi:winged helix-turn-helix domain-containing protein [Natranaerobius thermophilus]|uniref:Stage 0 sporulation protein A homolog n=1 Tax=Natranaerobius thermophilus (strain ATCC BAA-1301 / DSM 18059 / JW/NM-WN-LF) TaxID=457570 RepID=B2A444_NATTJ|nr:winged helix-turn-helix domain-containing protein [Natranaerobius thermophilus]ACB86450.1 two component transcriptional regulator, winged helix family [Natranaerobius thermophilus JW/NM-WN-LF]